MNKNFVLSLTLASFILGAGFVSSAVAQTETSAPVVEEQASDPAQSSAPAEKATHKKHNKKKANKAAHKSAKHHKKHSKNNAEAPKAN